MNPPCTAGPEAASGSATLVALTAAVCRFRDDMFAMLMADRLGIDLAEAITAKLEANGLKYPVDLARGSARKYTDLGEA